MFLILMIGYYVYKYSAKNFNLLEVCCSIIYVMRLKILDPENKEGNKGV